MEQRQIKQSTPRPIPDPDTVSESREEGSAGASGPARWYVLSRDQYRGPLTDQQIESSLLEGRIGPDTLLWKSAFPDWQRLREIAEFSAITSSIPEQFADAWMNPELSALDFADLQNDSALVSATEQVVSPAASSPAKIFAAEETTSEQKKSNHPATRETDHLANPENQIQSGHPPPALEKNPTALALPVVDFTKELEFAPMTFKEKMIELVQRPLVAAALILTIGGGTTAFMVNHVMYPLDRLDDVSADDYRELTAAARDRGQLPAVAIAMSISDRFSPIFYVASNFKEGTRLKIQIDGVAETLLDRLDVSVDATETVHHGLVKTPFFRQENGTLFPRGDYRVSVTCLNCEGEKAADPPVIGQKTFFVGGTRDLDYDQKLKVFHEKLQTQAADEVAEIKQLTATLEGQLSDGEKIYHDARKKISGDATAIPSTVNGFNGKWRHLQGQLDAEFNRWTADAIRTGFIYGHLFQAIKDAGAAITQLHQDQAIELEHAGENAVFGAKVESDAATVRAMLTAIHDKTKSIENVPTTANGLPLRP